MIDRAQLAEVIREAYVASPGDRESSWELEAADAVLARVGSEVEELRAEAATFRVVGASITAERDALQFDNNALREIVERLRLDVAGWEQQSSALSDRVSILADECDRLREQVRVLTERQP